MSKSVGNFTIIRDVLADWPGDVVRLTMLSSHYRQADQLDREGSGRGREGAGRFLRRRIDPKPSRVRLRPCS